jgi:high-affinity iron transporter
MRRPELRSSVWAGVSSAALLSLGPGVILSVLGLSFEGRAEQIFEGATMLLAAGILTWMIFWMARQARKLTADLESGVQRAARGGRGSLFRLAFLAVLPEVELASS